MIQTKTELCFSLVQGPHTNHFLLQAPLHEVQPIIDLLGQTPQIQPDVESRIRHILDLEAHLLQPPEDIVALHLEVRLQRFHFVQHLRGLEHVNGGFLERHIGAAVEVGTA